MNTIFTKTINLKNKQATLNVVNDNLAVLDEVYDLVVCSAYKGDYIPLRRTVIGTLKTLGVNVAYLAQNPQIDCRNLGAWISGETGNKKFKRVCCVELLKYGCVNDDPVDIILKKMFSTLKYVIEQAQIAGICLKKILLPILGVGSQGIELSYVIPPLLSQLTAIMQLEGVEEITFFEIDPKKAEQLKKYVTEALDEKNETDVFISYSSKQSDSAYKIAEILKRNNVSYWMAPSSIPPSRDYLDEIPNALTNTKMVLLLLTPESEASVWVAKEVATAMGANKVVIPCQMVAFEMSQKFTFLLDGCQIFPCFSQEDYAQRLIEIINANK